MARQDVVSTIQGQHTRTLSRGQTPPVVQPGGNHLQVAPVTGVNENQRDLLAAVLAELISVLEARTVEERAPVRQQRRVEFGLD